jgi:Hypoxia induced protein conserved region
MRLDAVIMPGLVAGAGRRCYNAPMATVFSTIIVPIAIGVVAIVLLLGLINMMRGGSPHLSQKLMRLRVLLQAVAIAIIMLTIWMMGR